MLICTDLGKQTTGCSWFLPWLSLKFFINHFWNGKKVNLSFLLTGDQSLENQKQSSHTFASTKLLNLLICNHSTTLPAPKPNKTHNITSESMGVRQVKRYAPNHRSCVLRQEIVPIRHNQAKCPAAYSNEKLPSSK